MRTAWLTLIALVPVLAGCGIDKRTSAFQCETDGDCDSDRRCEEGFCTVGPRDLADAARGAGDGPVGIDAAPADAFTCPAACTGGCLEDSTCVIDKHRGQFSFETEIGLGTSFTIKLPIDGPRAASEAAA